MDLATIATTVGTGVQVLNGLTEWVKSISGKTIGQDKLAEVNGHILELQHLLIQMQQALIAATNELAAKDKEIAGLRGLLEQKAQAVFRDNALWFNEDGPYCPGCWGNAQKAIHLQDLANGYWSCPTCKQVFGSVSVRRRGGRESG